MRQLHASGNAMGRNFMLKVVAGFVNSALAHHRFANDQDGFAGYLVSLF